MRSLFITLIFCCSSLAGLRALDVVCLENEARNRDTTISLVSSEISRHDLGSEGVFQNMLAGIKVSPASDKIFFYTYNKAGKSFSFDLFDLKTNTFTHIRNKVSFSSSGLLQACFGFSRSENQCYTLLDENYLQVFNTESGEEIFHYKGHKRFYEISISPPGISYDPVSNQIKPDNSYLIVGDNNLVKQLKDEADYMNFFDSGTPDFSLEIPKNAFEIEYSPVNSLIACNSGIFPKKLFLCDLTTGKLVLTFEEAPGALLYIKMRFSADGRYLMAILGKEMVVWDVSTGKIAKKIQVHDKALFDFDISKDNILVTSGLDERLHFWDINNGFEKIHTISPTKRKGNPVCCSYVNFSADGTKLYAVSFSNELIVYELKIQ